MSETKHKQAQYEKAQVWLRYLRAGKAKRKQYDDHARETLAFFHPTHREFWDDAAISGAYDRGDARSGFRTSVNKAAQLVSVMTPRLQHKSPTRTLISRTQDGVMLALAKVLEKCLSYTPDEAALSRENKRAVIDALLRGRGFLRVGWDNQYGVITSWWVPSNRVILDPDAETVEDAKWVAIEGYEPVWEIKRRLKESGVERWRWKDLKGNCTSDVEKDNVALRDEDDWGIENQQEVEDSFSNNGTNHMVRFFEIYSKQGHGLVRGKNAPDQYKHYDDSKDYVRIVVAPGHDFPLEEGPWDMPFYLDACCGPLVPLDLVETIDQLWPDSVFAQALPHAKAIDLLTTDALEAAWVHTRDIFFTTAGSLDERAREQVGSGGLAEVVEVKPQTPGEADIRRIMHRFDTGVLTPEVREERQFHIQQFEQITGMTAPVHGGGSSGGIERSATASQLQFDSSMTRLDGMKADVEDWATKSARMEALAWRTSEVVDVDTVQKIVGDEFLGFRVALNVGGVSLPLRGEPLSDGSVGSLEQIAPQAATVFWDEAQAQQAHQVVVQALAQPADESVSELVRQIMLDPAFLALGGGLQGLMQYVRLQPVTVEDVWDATAGIAPEDLFREFSWKIASTSGERWNKQRAQKFAETAVGQVMPMAMQIGDYATVNKIWEVFFRAFEVPDEDQFQIQPPAPPPQEGQPPA